MAKKPDLDANSLKDMIVEEALLLAHNQKRHINDLLKYALKYEECLKDKENAKTSL